MNQSISELASKRATIFVFEKTPKNRQWIKSTPISPLAQIAIEIVTASQNGTLLKEDLWAYGTWDSELKQILVWQELTNTQYYSVELTPSLSFFWRDSVQPYIAGKSPLIDSDILCDLATRLDTVVDYIENSTKHSFLKYVDIDIQALIDEFLDELVEDCRLNSSDVFTNAFNLKVYHLARSKTR